MIRFCGCKHEAQDRMYGPQQRVHNKCGSGKASKGKITCTVCGTKK
jgi:hypothetical protein